MEIKIELLKLNDECWRRLSTRLEGLTDEEYVWEPAPECWTVRADGDGSVRSDWGLIFTEDAPLTTISWRMCHLIELLKAQRCAVLLGHDPEPNAHERWLPVTAADALVKLEQAHATWRRYLATTDESKLGSKLGPAGGQYADETRLGLVLHILDEFVHHAAEIATLRDLYRASRPQDAALLSLLRAEPVSPGDAERVKREHPDLMVRAAATGRWDAIPALLEAGFAIGGPDGRSVLHHAAADGRVELVRVLLDAGADPTAKDPTYDATPLEWARYFSRNEVVEYLEGAVGVS